MLVVQKQCRIDVALTLPYLTYRPTGASIIVSLFRSCTTSTPFIPGPPLVHLGLCVPDILNPYKSQSSQFPAKWTLFCILRLSDSAIPTSMTMANSSKFVPAKLWLPTYNTTAQDSSIRTLPELLEYNAEHNPANLFCQQARRSNESLQLFTVTHSQLRDAVSRCQQWLRETVNELELPHTGEDGRFIKGPPVALFMESDVGLWVHLLALLGLGVPVLLLSARLSPTAISHLLATTGALAMVVSPRLYGTAEEGGLLLQAGDLHPILYERNPYEFFLERVGALARSERSICAPGYHSDETDRQVIILHSSGTTGLPKPIYQSHEYLLGFAAAHAFSSDEEAQHLNLSTLPLYHVSQTRFPTYLRIDRLLEVHVDLAALKVNL